MCVGKVDNGHALVQPRHAYVLVLVREDGLWQLGAIQQAAHMRQNRRVLQPQRVQAWRRGRCTKGRRRQANGAGQALARLRVPVGWRQSY